MNRIMKFAALFALLAAFSFGQTAISSTTLTPNITATTTTFAIGSATGVTGLGSLGQYTTMLYIDHELMGVRSISGTNVTVDRGKGSTNFLGEASQTTHKAAVTVWLGPPVAFYNTDPVVGSQCVRTSLVYVPYISVSSGKAYDCLGLTTAGRWVRTDANGPGVLGATVASAAATLAPSGTIFSVSGTAAITGLTAPAGAAPGFTITILPTGVFTWTTGLGTIGLAGTAVVGKTLVFTLGASGVFYPSYIA